MPENDSITVTIYSLASSEDGEIRYIGQTTYPLNKRLRFHINEARREKANHRHHWINSVIAAGHQVLIAPVKENAVLHQDEVEFIAQYRADGYRLVNATSGGEGTPGIQYSEERKARISASLLGNQFGRNNKGRKFTDEHKQKLSEKLTGNQRSKGKEPWNKGLPVSDEVKQKISASQIGRPGKPMTAEHKQKLIAIHMSRKVSDETKRKMGEARSGEKNGIAKLTAETIVEIKDLLSQGVTQKVIAKTFGICQQNVSRIKRGEAWCHVK